MKPSGTKIFCGNNSIMGFDEKKIKDSPKNLNSNNKQHKKKVILFVISFAILIICTIYIKYYV